MESYSCGSAHWYYKLQELLHGFRYLKEVKLTHLQVVHPVLTLGVLLLDRLTFACLVASLSDLSPDGTSFSTRLMGSLWLSLGSITDAITILCTEKGDL